MKKLVSFLLAGIIAVSATAAVSAEENAPAKGIKFKSDSGYKANMYTHYLEGVEIGDTAGDILGALENREGVAVYSYKSLDVSPEAIADDVKVQYGDVLALSSADSIGSVYATVAYVGDANMDSKLSINDVTIALKSIEKWGDLVIDASLADVNGDGGITVNDVTLLLKKIAKHNVSFVKSPVLPGKGNMASNQKIDGYSTYYDEGKGSRPMPIMPGDEVGMKFSVAEGKYAKSAQIFTHSLADNKGELRFSLFVWNQDYETTVASDPVVTEKFVDYKDNSDLILNLCDNAGKGIGQGEYLLLIHEGFDTDVDENGTEKPNGVGLWMAKRPLDDSGVMIYYQGTAMEASVSYAFGIIGSINIGN